MSDEPLLFIDVDGVLNPDSSSSGRRPDGYVTHRMRPSGPWQDPRHKALRVWLNPSHGGYLADLPLELVWGTTWEDEANEWIAPHLGLPALPVVHFENKLGRRVHGVHWKTPDLVKYAAGRPFAWLDDEITVRDVEYVRERHGGPAALVWVAPFTGLTEDHLQRLRLWCESLDDVEKIRSISHWTVKG